MWCSKGTVATHIAKGTGGGRVGGVVLRGVAVVVSLGKAVERRGVGAVVGALCGRRRGCVGDVVDAHDRAAAVVRDGSGLVGGTGRGDREARGRRSRGAKLGHECRRGSGDGSDSSEIDLSLGVSVITVLVILEETRALGHVEPAFSPGLDDIEALCALLLQIASENALCCPDRLRFLLCLCASVVSCLGWL